MSRSISEPSTFCFLMSESKGKNRETHFLSLENLQKKNLDCYGNYLMDLTIQWILQTKRVWVLDQLREQRP